MKTASLYCHDCGGDLNRGTCQCGCTPCDECEGCATCDKHEKRCPLYVRKAA